MVPAVIAHTAILREPSNSRIVRVRDRFVHIRARFPRTNVVKLIARAHKIDGSRSYQQKEHGFAYDFSGDCQRALRFRCGQFVRSLFLQTLGCNRVRKSLSFPVCDYWRLDIHERLPAVTDYAALTSGQNSRSAVPGVNPICVLAFRHKHKEPAQTR